MFPPEYVNPYKQPGLYDTVGVDSRQGVTLGERRIGLRINEEERKAKRLKSIPDKQARLDAVRIAKEILREPGARVLVDFFVIPDDVVGDVCREWAERLTRGPLPTHEVIASFFPKKRFDDLVPEDLGQFVSDVHAVPPRPIFDIDGGIEGALPLAVVEL